jgi:hypothetical protein
LVADARVLRNKAAALNAVLRRKTRL